ncbi:hypothetical protein RHS04_00659 [Rhizoctonia solani]|uniref:Uncharacterized protein n=1 Tax=Rhizoctonia solani TaxID=456999 RepID=A0A8H7HEW1_9AGAM|nr:hypothetical protein RHS04_00659 [Rhizoctonia solani]
MPENNSKRESGTKHSNAWVESSFTAEPPSTTKRRRVDNTTHDTPVARVKPKAPTWVASEFQAQASPTKPHVRPPPLRPKDPGSARIATNPTFQFTDPNVSFDPQATKQISARPLSVQAIPPFLPKGLTDKSIHRTHDPVLFHIQTPIFQTKIQSSAAVGDLIVQKEVIPMPPPPRIESKIITAPDTSTFVDREYVALTDLATPRVFENVTVTSRKGKECIVSNDGNPPISDVPAVEESTKTAEGETEAFGMNGLSLVLDRDTSHAGNSNNSGRKLTSKFIKGGLAARALMVISQREKDDALWHHYQTAKLSKSSNVRADLQVHAVKFMQRVGDSLLLRCTLPPGETINATRSLVVSRDVGNTLVEPVSVYILLSQPGTKDLPVVEPNAVIRLWKPWIEINLDSVSRALPTLPTSQVGDKEQETPVVVGDGTDATRERSVDTHRHPEPPRSYGEISAPDRRPQIALLCSRFIVG